MVSVESAYTQMNCSKETKCTQTKQNVLHNRIQKGV